MTNYQYCYKIRESGKDEGSLIPFYAWASEEQLKNAIFRINRSCACCIKGDAVSFHHLAYDVSGSYSSKSIGSLDFSAESKNNLESFVDWCELPIPNK